MDADIIARLADIEVARVAGVAVPEGKLHIARPATVAGHPSR